MCRPDGPSGVVVTRHGARFRLHGHDLNEWYVATQRAHSSEVSACLDRLCAAPSDRKACVLWDIGANIGAVTIPFLVRNHAARAVCFEPSPEVAGRLLENLRLNGSVHGRAEVISVPLGERDGPVDFFVSSEPFNSGVGGLGESHNRAAQPIRTVSVRGDAVPGGWKVPEPTIVKIDVEGFELEVLRGMHRILRDQQPAVIFEHSGYRIRERAGRSASDVCDFLETAGYQVFDLSGTQSIRGAELSSDCDLLALPRC
jgi:FkbM family methyltransferase